MPRKKINMQSFLSLEFTISHFGFAEDPPSAKEYAEERCALPHQKGV